MSDQNTDNLLSLFHALAQKRVEHDYTNDENQQKSHLSQQNELAKLTTQDQMGQQETARNIEMAKKLRLDPGMKNLGAVNLSGTGGVSLGYNEPRQNSQKIALTPAQTRAEQLSGKAIADYEVSGGRGSLEKNINSLTEATAELGGPGANNPGVKKRDAYDRIVGGLSNKVGLASLFAPTEKARMDKVRNTALTIARQTDPNPTEKQVEAIMGQVYDPASSDEENLNRANRFLEEQKQKAAQIEGAANNYHRTGYATLGIGSNSARAAPTQRPVVQAPTPQSPGQQQGSSPMSDSSGTPKAVKHVRSKKTGKVGTLYSDGIVRYE